MTIHELLTHICAEMETSGLDPNTVGDLDISHIDVARLYEFEDERPSVSFIQYDGRWNVTASNDHPRQDWTEWNLPRGAREKLIGLM